jgi:hypothetical protein
MLAKSATRNGTHRIGFFMTGSITAKIRETSGDGVGEGGSARSGPGQRPFEDPMLV